MPPERGVDSEQGAGLEAESRVVAPHRKFTYWRDPLCIGGVALYLLNRLVLKPLLLPYVHVHSPFLHGHLNDFLLVPVMLPLFLMGYRLLGLRRHDSPPSAGEIALHVVIWSIFFEVYGPMILHRSVGDPWDAASYAAGGLCAWALWQGVVYRARGVRSTSHKPSDRENL